MVINRVIGFFIDFKLRTEKSVSVDAVNDAIIEASNSNSLKGILGTYDVPLVSSDFIHDTRSSIFALKETKVIDGDFVRILSWYDNEWGFSNRMLDTAIAMKEAS